MLPAERGSASNSASDDGDRNPSNAARVSEEVKDNVLLVLETEPRGINVDSLATCYWDKIGKKLNFKKNGFDSLVDMLKTIQDIR